MAIVLLMAVNLRGVRESGTAFAVPTYVFMVAILGMAGWGFLRLAMGDLPDVESAQFTLVPESDYENGITGLAGAFLLLRAFSSGCAALTGVEAISNGVPAFRKPKSKNAATTLLLLGTIAVTMLDEHHRARQGERHPVRRERRRAAAAERRAGRAVAGRRAVPRAGCPLRAGPGDRSAGQGHLRRRAR